MLTSEQRVEFEKARFHYCKELFEQEVARKELIEKKAHFYLTFISLFLGALFLNLKSLTDFFSKISVNNKLSPWPFYLPIIALWFSLLIALLSVLQSMRLRKWKGNYPNKVLSSLFAPDSKYLSEKTEEEFLRVISMEYILAWEQNRQVNYNKAKWVKISAQWVLMAVVAVFIFVGINIFNLWR